MKLILSFFLLIVVILKIVALAGCANIIPPTGGPQDTLPPVIVRAYPPDSTTEFKSKTITLVFDEYIELQSLNENLIVSPMPIQQPYIESKLKTLTVKIKDTLEANTTYSFNFGKAIKDVNEGNVLNNFSYIFTTGKILDSLELTGKVLLAETGGSDSTLIVMLHKSGEDSAVANEKPRFIAKLDSSGNFRFRYLPAGTYYLYALKDESGTKKYFNKTQLFAFSDQPVEIKPGTGPVTLYASAEKKQEAGNTNLSLSSGVAKKGDEKRLKFTSTILNNLHDLLSPLSLSFEQPLKNFDTTKLLLSTDSTYIPETNYSWQTDSVKKNITLHITWKENTKYNIILNKEFAEDSSGRTLLKTDTLHFTTKKTTDYGSVKINFSNLDLSKNPVLQFCAGTQVIKSYPLNATSFYEPLFFPGDYELKMFNDDNKNGKWDPGEFWKKRKQPEIVKPVGKKITIKANWDNEFEIAAPLNLP